MIRHTAAAAGLAALGITGGAYESALLSLSRGRLRELLEERGGQANDFLNAVLDGDSAPRLAAALLHAVGMGGFILYALVCVAEPLAVNNGGWTARNAMLAAVGLILLQGILRAASALAGETDPERLVLSGARAFPLLTLPLRPFVYALLALQALVARGMGVDQEKTEEEEREEELLAAVSDGVLDEVVEEGQRDMIEGIFELKDSDVADIMTPRTEMVFVNANFTVAEAIAVAIEKGFSRMPVYRDTRDNIIGIFFVRDALQYWSTPRDQGPRLPDLLRKPVFVPETKKVSDLLREMQRDKNHLCVVLDEYGGTAGLVTIEDILEEIVGEIQDEFDEGETQPEIERLDANTLRASAQAHVSDINGMLDLDVIPEDDDYETLAGFVLNELGHIPAPGEEFDYQCLHLRVLSADERKVDVVEIRRNPEFVPEE